MNEPTYGVSQTRREDARLLLGRGRFTADLQPEGLCHAVFVRSPHGHARIARIDTTAASSSPGVIAILTATDLAADGIGSIMSTVELKRPDGAPAASTPRPLLIDDVVRHLGEPVAVVVASTRMEALDAGELVEVDYDPLPAVTSCREALVPGAPTVWADAPDNIAFLWRHGDRAAVDKALVSAAHVTRLDYGVSRVAAMPLEPPDSKEETDGFVRGVCGLEEVVKAAQERTGQIVGYVGEWHSHPPNHSSKPSGDDLLLLGHLAVRLSEDGQPALMLIAGEEGERWLTAVEIMQAPDE